MRRWLGHMRFTHVEKFISLYKESEVLSEKHIKSIIYLK